MRLIIDANELFSFFNEKSKARELSLLPEIELYAPSFALKEINKYKADIKKKFKLSDFQFETIQNFMHTVVKFLDVEAYKDKMYEAQSISPDHGDVDYLALALKLKYNVWSEDKDLKKQKKVNIISTSELMDLLDLD